MTQSHGSSISIVGAAVGAVSVVCPDSAVPEEAVADSVVLSATEDTVSDETSSADTEVDSVPDGRKLVAFTLSV